MGTVGRVDFSYAMASTPQTGLVPFRDGPLPANEEAERTILGAIILDPDLIIDAIQGVRAEDFHSPLNGRVFAAMTDLFERSVPIEPIMIEEVLKKDGTADLIGGVAGITNLAFGIPHYSDIDNYLKLVRDKALIRRLIHACNRIMYEARDDGEEARVILDRAEQLIFDIAESRAKGGFVSVNEVAQLVLLKVEELSRRQTHALTGLATGYRDFDQLTSGLQPGELVIIAARPSMGKTALCLNIAQNAALQENAVVGVFSLEMSKEALAMRMLSSQAHIDSMRFRRGMLSPAEWTRLAEAIATLAEARLYIDDTGGMTILELRAKARRLIAEHKRLDLIIIDYLQLVRAGKDSDPRHLIVSIVSRELKALAKELKVPVVALAQLSRNAEGRPNQRPMLSDLRESGSIEQDADVVAFIYREEYYSPTEENKGLADLIVAKQRNGPTGSVKLAFLKEFTRFENYYEG